MKKGFLYCLFLLMYFPISLFAQNSKGKDHYTYQVREEDGDLNKDGTMDKVVVQMDTVDKTRPMRVQIFLSQPNGKFALAVSSTKMIEPQYPAGNKGEFNAYQIPSFFIEKGILKMWSEIKGGNITYDFKYNNGHFELINVNKITHNATKGYTDQNTIFTETNFDLVTGIRIEIDEVPGSAKARQVRKKKVLIRPLPKIHDFKFSDKEIY